MPAATNKADLLSVTEREFRKLDTLIKGIDASTALAKDPEDPEDTSIKDVVAHRAHWIDLFLGWRADGLAGKQAFFPAKGYKWSELKRYNADLRGRQARLSWAKACALLRDRHQALVQLIASETDRSLYGGPMKGANNNWTAGRWAEASGASHYRSAAKYIRARLREIGDG